MKNVKKLEETIQRVATNTIGYTRKQANKEWFDEECAKVNEPESEPSKSKSEEPRMLKNQPGQKRGVCAKKKARQLDEEALIEIERHWSIQDSRKFYKLLNDVRRPFDHKRLCVVPKTGNYTKTKCWRDGNILKKAPSNQHVQSI
jgi:hypothetical protein